MSRVGLSVIVNTTPGEEPQRGSAPILRERACRGAVFAAHTSGFGEVRTQAGDWPHSYARWGLRWEQYDLQREMAMVIERELRATLESEPAAAIRTAA